MTQSHPIPPLYDGASRVLILGSFPSVQSRAGMFFYHHPQNRFWQVLSAVLGCETPASVPDKRMMLLAHGVALWDVIARCDIEGSADATIRAVEPTDLRPILAAAPIRRIFCNGGTAWKLYQKHQFPRVGIPAIQLPSTSPANAAWRLPALIEAWRVVLEDANG
ncbi:MAG: DNA-deoxyinosine glycosylase [Oscillospiraceae bacterium]|nr:DNA-deoxyinosine glycosylase [Oscillospiraceae bacterium]